VLQARGVAEWIAGALAENDFREFEEPYRRNPAAGSGPRPRR